VDVEESDGGILEGVSRHLVEGIEKNRNNISEVSQSLGRYMNSGLPEYEARMLTTQPRRLVLFSKYGRLFVGGKTAGESR
jgi:hypothetical protein